MNISVFGLGYVGAVSIACLAKAGHNVIGVDPIQSKVDAVASGQSPIIENGIDELLRSGVQAGRIRATTDAAAAVASSELSLVCVGTPSQANGSLDLKYVRAVCEEIGAALAHKREYHVVAVRSTVLPGTIKDTVIPLLEATSGKSAGEDFGVCSNPEFLREGTSVHDYFHPPKTVIGESDARAGDVLESIYRGLDAPLLRVPVETAEMVKYSDNAWHALKVCFANEIGNLCKVLGIDSHQVMEIFCSDRKLNLSPYYLKPGFAFGGSCLPKDVRALTYKARTLDVEVPVLSSILPSNELQIELGLSLIQRKGKKRIGVLGFSFKAGTDDLRESPMVEVIERLIGKGFDVRLFDHNVNLAKLVGANKGYILERIPHVSGLMADSIDEVLEHSEVVVIGNRAPEFSDAIRRVDETIAIVDLVRIGEHLRDRANYEGICW